MTVRVFRALLLLYVVILLATLFYEYFFDSTLLDPARNYARELAGWSGTNRTFAVLYVLILFGTLILGVGGLYVLRKWGRWFLTGYFLVGFYPVYPAHVSSNLDYLLDTLMLGILVILLYESWFSVIANELTPNKSLEQPGHE